MPIGAIIGGVASIGGALLSSSGQKKAANTAANAAKDTAATNNALALNIYGQNKAALSPYSNNGMAASNAINSLLGIGGTQFQPQLEAQGGQASMTQFAPQGFMDSFNPQDYSRSALGDVGMERPYAVNPHYGQPTYGFGNETRQPVQTMGQAQQPALQPGMSPQQAQSQAFDAFRGSTGYQFRLGQGQEAINTGYAANGALRSGAALKSLAGYNQNMASGEFGNYMGYLSNQQGVGLGAASALAGVGQGYVNNVTANNDSAGTAAANAALMKGQANANMWGGIANGVGSIFGSSFK